MRQILCVVVVAVGLFGSRLAAEIKVEKPKETTVTGYGETTALAEESAWREAKSWITEALAESGVNWKIPEQKLDLTYLTEKKVLTAEGKIEKDEEAGGALRARFHVVLRDDYVAAVRKQAREDQLEREKGERREHVVDRQLILVRVLGGAVAALLIVTGYLRLEEATRGYYTKLLRLGAFVLLALAVALLWTTI